MNSIILQFLYDFILIFLLFYIIYRVFVIKKKKTFSKLKKNDEVRLFVLRYNIDIKKINYKKLLNIISIINAFIISFTSALILNIDSFIWSIIVSFVLIMILSYSLFELAGRYFKKMEVKDV